MEQLSLRGKRIEVLHSTHPDNLTELLLSLRGSEESFFRGDIIHDPLLLPDIQKAIERIAFARENRERSMIF